MVYFLPGASVGMISSSAYLCTAINRVSLFFRLLGMFDEAVKLSIRVRAIE